MTKIIVIEIQRIMIIENNGSCDSNDNHNYDSDKIFSNNAVGYIDKIDNKISVANINTDLNKGLIG